MESDSSLSSESSSDTILGRREGAPFGWDTVDTSDVSTWCFKINRNFKKFHCYCTMKYYSYENINIIATVQ